jgi:UDP-2-acetamido-3-amino-2,3-dideoxy-glucuronate N-acetyltransferase
LSIVPIAPNIFVHSHALCESEQIGPGTQIWAFAHVMKGAVVGRDCNIGDHSYIETGARIGDRVTIKNQVMVWDGVDIADDVFIGPGVSFTNDRRPRSPRMTLPAVAARYRNREGWLARTRVEKGASIGAGCVILAGVKIGAYAMAAAGAVVTCDIPAHALVAGMPAHSVGWVCRCGARMQPSRNAAWRCPQCGESFDELTADGCTNLARSF